MKLLISACLLGLPCRYDGQSKPLPPDALDRLRAKFDLVPVCPEQLGGLPTPRTPSERREDRVVMRTGADVTAEFRRGAESALAVARLVGAKTALLKARSPSCGKGRIYDGSFSGTLTDGNGVTAEVLLEEGFAVYDETEVENIKSEE